MMDSRWSELLPVSRGLTYAKIVLQTYQKGQIGIRVASRNSVIASDEYTDLWVLNFDEMGFCFKY